MFRDISGPSLLIILILVVVLFGSKRLPDAARGIGRSLRIFKAETKGLMEDGQEPPAIAAPPVVQQVAPVQTAPVQTAPVQTAPVAAPVPAPVQPTGTPQPTPPGSESDQPGH